VFSSPNTDNRLALVEHHDLLRIIIGCILLLDPAAGDPIGTIYTQELVAAKCGVSGVSL